MQNSGARREQAKDLAIPDRSDDAAERKRVLNILAQRRYRKRKREQFEALESQLQRERLPVGTQEIRAPPQLSLGEVEEEVRCSQPEQQRTSNGPMASSSQDNVVCHRKKSESSTWQQQSIDRRSIDHLSTDSDTGMPSNTHQLDTIATIVVLPEPREQYGDLPPLLLHSNGKADQPHPSGSFKAVSQTQSPKHRIQDLDFAADVPIDPDVSNASWNWDPSILLPELTTTATDSFCGRSRFSSREASFPSPSASSTAATTPRMPSPLPQLMDLSSALQENRTKHYNFPDEKHINCLEISLLRAALAVARRLGINDLVFEFTATSPFAAQGEFCDYTHLPLNIRPTRTQLSIPHHPMLDVLPWPIVRNKLILVLSQPVELRPHQAASETALLDFIFDMEDSTEGIRIWGDDACCETNWEVGEALFSKWWWLLDSEIIKNSNQLRMLRGAPSLGDQTVG